MAERTAAIPVTLTLVRSGDRLLMLRYPEDKDRFAGRWSLPGGHVEEGEDVRAAARREVLEEALLDPGPLRLRAVIHETGLLGRTHLLFAFEADVGSEHVFESARAGPAGELRWVTRDHVPWDDVVPDLRVIIPRLLDGNDVLFGVQEFDGGDGPVRFELG